MVANVYTFFISNSTYSNMRALDEKSPRNFFYYAFGGFQRKHLLIAPNLGAGNGMFLLEYAAISVEGLKTAGSAAVCDRKWVYLAG